MTPLPYPVAQLLRRARNAKSPRDRHDVAFSAWEAAVHLAVAATPPRDPSVLARATLGPWVAALDVGDAASDVAAVRAVGALFATRDPAAPVTTRKVRLRDVLDAVPEYRNKLIGHGTATQSAEFYDAAHDVLVAGLAPLFASGVFFPADARLVAVDAVEIDAAGARKARVLDLSGEAPSMLSPRGGMDVPKDVLPHRVYVVRGESWRSLHPWLLHRERDGRSEVFFFAKIARRAEYLDFHGGTWLRGSEIEDLVPGTEAELRALFAGAGTASEPDDAADVRRFGDFDLLGKLGGGGMGVVCLARQRSLDRIVALKMLAPESAADRKAAARFRQEMEALALCDHPHVVKILASGEEDGRLWYAMEHVEGADLAAVAGELASSSGLGEAISSASEKVRAAHADAFASLPVVPRGKPALSAKRRDQVAELGEAMRDAARGLAHLHEAGVIHRDVKPGNLMLTPERRVVVMDLGLARMRDASGSLSKDQKSVLGTLRYMPPEQLNRRLVPVDERSDVYGLGATFYELLTGHPLFEAADDQQLIVRVLRDEPVAPRRANPRLPEDLATIVGKCIAKDPRERYASMPAVADDLDAWLEGRPISARPPSFGYYAKLAVRRNPSLAAAMAGLVAVLVAAVVVSLRLVDQAEVQRARAAGERARAEELANFMLFDLRDGLQPIGRTDLLATVATRVKAYYDERRHEELSPEEWQSCAAALANVGEVRRAQGDLPGALECHLEGLAIRRRLQAAAPSSADAQRAVADSLDRLGDVQTGQGDFAGARASYLEFLDIARRLAAAGPGDSRAQHDLSVALNRSGDVRAAQGDIAAALAHYRESLEIRRRLVASDPTNAIALRDVATALVNVAGMQEDQGDLAGALANLRESLAIDRGVASRDPANADAQQHVSADLERVGRLLQRQGDLPGALASHEESLGICRRLASADPTNVESQRDLAVSLMAVGEVHSDLGDADRALAGLREGEDVLRRLTGGASPSAGARLNLANVLARIGAIRIGQGDLPDALASFEESLSIGRRLEADGTGGNSKVQTVIAYALERIGDVRLDQGSLVAARASYEGSLAALRRVAGLDSTNLVAQRGVFVSLSKLSHVQRRQGDVDGGLASLRESLEIVRRLAADGDSDTDSPRDLMVCLSEIGSAHFDRGDIPAALASYREFVDVARRVAAASPGSASAQRDLSVGLNRIGDVQFEQRDFARALASYRESLEIRRRAAEDLSDAQAQGDFAFNLNCVGQALESGGDPAGALEHFGQALRIARRLAEADPTNAEARIRIAFGLESIGNIRVGTGDLAGALSAHRESLEIRRALSTADPSDVSARRDVAVALHAMGHVLSRQRADQEALAAAREALDVHAEAVRMNPAFAREHEEWVERERASALLAGVRTPAGPADELTLASALYQREDFELSAAHYERALAAAQAPRSAGDATLYDAACAAALASRSGTPGAGTRWRTRATEWLAEYVRGLRDRLRTTSSELAAGPPADRAAELQARRARDERAIEWARTGDSDMAPLRNTPEFEAIFTGPGPVSPPPPK